ncbi:MAG: DUF296 domain-containing protein [Actinobacteria bacterium]|nr:DUF296 domain-containing protein [Actinomycetota bacterium]
MDYQIGRIGRIAVARFGDGEELLKNLTSIARKEDIKAAVFYLLGGMQKGRIVVGPEKDELPPTPVWREISESSEIFGMGTIFWEGDIPKIHFHGALGKRDMVRVGCLRESAEVFLVLEAIIIEIEGVSAIRELDPATGLSLLKLVHL